MGKKAAGFITLHRQIMDWEWYRHPHTAFLFIHLLLSAKFTDGYFNGIPIKRGQVVTSIPRLSTDTGLSVQQTKTALSHLRLTGEITDDANHQYRVITVVKYDEYQKLTDKNFNDQPQTNRQNLQRLTDESFNDQPHNNNITNKHTNKGTIKEPLKGSVEEDSWFDVFWNEYPRKVDKQSAIRAWKKIKPDASLMARIMDGLRRWKESEQWTKENGQYIPYPATWLNKQRWEDEVKKAQHVSQQRILPAQDFEQRDYSDVPADDMAKLAAEIKAAREAGII